MAENTVEKPTSKSPLLPCNDPARPCWQFLSDVLGKGDDPYRPPADEREAFVLLRQLLAQAFQERPMDLLRMAILGEGKGGMKRKFDAFLQHMKARGLELETSELEKSPNNFGEDPVFRSAANYILRHWVSLNEDGRKSTPKKTEYQAIGASSKEPIAAWLPNRAGVVPHLRGTTETILRQYYTIWQENDRMSGPSLDMLQSEFALEIATDGRFVRQAFGNVDEDPETAAFERGLDTSTSRLDRDGKGETDERRQRAEEEWREAMLGSTPVGPESDQNSPESRRRLLDGQINALRAEGAEWPLLVFNSSYDASAEVTSRRNSVRALFEKMRPFDRDLADDWAVIIESLDEWDGVTPLKKTVPELFELAERHRYVLAGIDQPAKEKELFQHEEIAAVHEVLIPGEPPSPSAPQIAHEHFSRSLQTLFEMVEDDDAVDLDSPERGDYLFLCERAGVSPGDPYGPNLHQEMRRLLRQWLSLTLSGSRASAANEEMRESMSEFASFLEKRWEPEKETLGERLSLMASDRVRRIEKSRAAPPLAAVEVHYAQQPGLSL